MQRFRSRRLTLARAALGVAAALWCAAGLSAQSRGPRALDPSQPIGTFIADGEPGERVEPGDRQLAQWALDAWQRAAGATLRLRPTTETLARVRVYWAGPQSGQYGEMRALMVNGQPGAAVYIRPDTASLGPDIDAAATSDRLFRDTVVYLTCVHELGHAFGLEHTADVRDIMYSFQYGGDFVEYFSRYRRQLTTRADMARIAGLSDADRARIAALYPPSIRMRHP